MNQAIRKGKIQVITAIVIGLAVDLVSNALTAIYLGKTAVVVGIIRLFFTVTLFYFLYKGKRWAWWAVLVLIGFAEFMALKSLFTEIKPIIASMALAYGIFLVLILLPTSQKFLAYQNRELTSNLFEEEVNTQE